MCGDFNLHGVVNGDSADDDFSELLDRFGMKQHVLDPTNRDIDDNRYNVLDLVIVPDAPTLLTRSTVVRSH